MKPYAGAGHSHTASTYASPASKGVYGLLFDPIDNDPRSIRSAELKDRGQWNAARAVDNELFQERSRQLGADHVNTIAVGYSMAESELEDGFLEKTYEWLEWTIGAARRVLGTQHPLTMRTESLMAHALYHTGDYAESQMMCANILARQQIAFGDGNIDTATTRLRLAWAYAALDRHAEALRVLEQVKGAMTHLFGGFHIRVIQAALDIGNCEISSSALRTPSNVQASLQRIQTFHQALNSAVGPVHPLTLRAQTMQGRALFFLNRRQEASEVLRQALATSEGAFGSEGMSTMEVVSNMGHLYSQDTSRASEAIPSMSRYLKWVESRKGAVSATQTINEQLGDLHFIMKDYSSAQAYYERGVHWIEGEGTVKTQQNRIRLQKRLDSCRIIQHQGTLTSTLGSVSHALSHSLSHSISNSHSVPAHNSVPTHNSVPAQNSALGSNTSSEMEDLMSKLIKQTTDSAINNAFSGSSCSNSGDNGNSGNNFTFNAFSGDNSNSLNGFPVFQTDPTVAFPSPVFPIDTVATNYFSPPIDPGTMNDFSSPVDPGTLFDNFFPPIDPGTMGNIASGIDPGGFMNFLSFMS